MSPREARRWPREHRAAIVFVLTSAVWLHEWLPALALAALVVWVILHARRPGDLGASAGPRGPLWPPSSVVLIPLLLASTLVYGVSDAPLLARLLPVALNLWAVATLVPAAGQALSGRGPDTLRDAAPGGRG